MVRLSLYIVLFSFVYFMYITCMYRKRGIRIRLDYGRKDTFISLLKIINAL